MDETIIIICSIAIAYLLDLLLGDPIWLPHPIVAFGKSISFFEKRFNNGQNRRIKGAVSSLFLCCSTFLAFYFFMYLAEKLGIWCYAVLNCIFLFYGLANKTLIKEGKDVFEVLNKQGLEAGRKQIARLVGRDTSQLSANQIKTATLETLSENLSDGVVAPLFYYAIGGIPAMMTYKMVNTLDSMIGYKSERYKAYGCFAAKTDDVANYLPARITALLMATVALSLRSFAFILKYRKAHSSPNAGFPEAALAGILNCRFGGDNVYHGKLISKPYIGKRQREINNSDIKKTARINHIVCLVMIMIICLKSFLLLI